MDYKVCDDGVSITNIITLDYNIIIGGDKNVPENDEINKPSSFVM